MAGGKIEIGYPQGIGSVQEKLEVQKSGLSSSLRCSGPVFFRVLC